jgi:hypothetical protein
MGRMSLSKFHKKKVYLGAALITLVMAQIACAALYSALNPTPETVVIYVTPTTEYKVVTAEPGNTPTQVNLDGLTDDQIKAGIQEALDVYTQAYNDNDPALLDQVVDQENRPFRRMVRSRFDEDQSSSDAGWYNYKYKVSEIHRLELGYIIAHFTDEMGNYYDWPFRLTEQGWVLTEPTVEQIGAPISTVTEYFTFTTYPWADDVNGRIMQMMETARQQVQDKLGVAPEEKALVEIAPIYGLNPYERPNAIAWYSEGGAADGGDLITIYTPNSFAFNFYDPHLGWDRYLQATLTHEYTHMAHARNFHNAGRLADWISEGLAEYVADEPGNVEQACLYFKAGIKIPILDESGAVAKQDLMHMTYLKKDTWPAYLFSHALVKFSVDEFDGMDGFWKLAKNIDKTGDFKKAVEQTFGISYDEFNRRWEKWLKGQC